MYNVLIRPLVETDALLSWKWRNDAEVWQYTGSKPDQYITYEIEKAWIEKALSDDTSRRFAIMANGEYVGNIQLTNIVENKTAEYHIFIGDKNYWGKSIAILATHQIIRYAKTVLKLEEIYLNVNPNNIPAIKVYEKCNFKQVNKNIKMVLNLSENNFPKVSIFMMVYNHEKYIKEALNGVLMQKYNFDYEIVIGEDCSTDESRNIILEYSKQFPGKFKLLLHNTNIGAQKNQLAVLENCIGQYIAMCEGDDYWTDPFKLQKQVDFLEANPDYVLSFHQVNILKTNGEIVNDFITKVPENYETIETLARLGNYIHTPSVVFRNVIKEFPFEFSQTPIGDYFLYMMLAEHGKLKYLEDNMAVYREGVGIWSDRSIYFRNFNTALLHAFLFDFFSRKENQLISDILIERIGRFIKNFESQITKEDLTILCSNKTIRNSIFDILLIDMEHLRNESIDKKKTEELIQIIFRRVKKRIWKK